MGARYSDKWPILSVTVTLWKQFFLLLYTAIKGLNDKQTQRNSKDTKGQEYKNDKKDKENSEFFVVEN